MADLLHGTSLQRKLLEVAQKSERAWLVSGFIKSGFLPRIGIREDADLRVVSRWRLGDLVSGGSDLEAAHEVFAFGAKFLIHPRIHAKVFLFDETAFVGSANLTGSGLPSIEGTGNLEAAVVTKNTSEIVEFIDDLTKTSVLLTDKLLKEIADEVEQLRSSQPTPATDTYSKMPTAFERVAKEQTTRSFTGADFPWCERPAEVMVGTASDPRVAHDLELFSLNSNPSLPELKEAFLNSRCYSWLKMQTQRDTRFGELTTRLHNALDGDPKPYRKDVKKLLSNLLAWSIELDPDGIHEQSYRRTRSYRSLD
ncbi:MULTISPECIES: phospholipase D-like domain-containing protein [unclassified Ruegeria]|uniref:phospholipase D-like domain-containing protein n=1 Tax=unclassified Ruegeria TaxID=2625375 RepID=UPI00149307BA|nr:MULTISPECIES: phospholipase D-like domain-containing protein [unclassified Ruegeria]NOD36649.1 hypothetical protein [Ruegeria sp. HKCCD7296]NOE43852.1 hypothetical protein [Ruegeria sp. HKCCD7319]